jgi:hypothetical protein
MTMLLYVSDELDDLVTEFLPSSSLLASTSRKPDADSTLVEPSALPLDGLQHNKGAAQNPD